MHSVFLPQSDGQRAFTVHNIVAQTAAPRVQPRPLDQWPFFLEIIAGFRHTDDSGIGDTVVHLIGNTSSERFKTWFKRKFGKDCGCTNRQRWLNARFPYPKTTREFPVVSD